MKVIRAEMQGYSFDSLKNMMLAMRYTVPGENEPSFVAGVLLACGRETEPVMKDLLRFYGGGTAVFDMATIERTQWLTFLACIQSKQITFDNTAMVFRQVDRAPEWAVPGVLWLCDNFGPIPLLMIATASDVRGVREQVLTRFVNYLGLDSAGRMTFAPGPKQVMAIDEGSLRSAQPPAGEVSGGSNL